MNGPVIIFDVETTGFDPHRDRVLELAMVDFDTGAILLHEKFNPQGRLIPDKVVEITGITNEAAAQERPFSESASRVAHIVAGARVILGYNPAFDRRMITAEFRKLANFTLPKWPMLICAKRLWDLNEPPAKRDLQHAFKRFVNPHGFEGAHGALKDTNATRDVFLNQFTHFPSLRTIPWEEMDPQAKMFWGGSEHVMWEADRLVWKVGKNKGTHVHQIDAGFWRWVVKPGNDFPEHVCVLADWMTHVFYDGGNKPEKTEEDLIVWARRKEQEL